MTSDRRSRKRRIALTDLPAGHGLRVFAVSQVARRVFHGQDRVREKLNFVFPFKPIWVVEYLGQKFLAFFLSEIGACSVCPGPKQGAYRERHIRWAGDAVDADVP